MAVTEGEDTVIADGDPVGISAEVLKDTFGALEGRFAIDDPLLGGKGFSEGFGVCGIFEMMETVGKDQFIFFEGIFEKIQKLAFEQRRHYSDGKKKSSTAGFPGATGRESTSGDNTMDVGMIHEILAPGVQNADTPDLCPEMFRVLCELCEGLGDRTEKKIVQDLAVHGDQGIKFRGEGEDHMEIRNGQEVLVARLDPSLFL